MNSREQSFASLILLEFLEVATHNILFLRKVYPDSIFTLRKKYNIPIHVSLYPPLNEYINNSLFSVRDILLREQPLKVYICFYDESSKLIEKLVFDIQRIFTQLQVGSTNKITDSYSSRLQNSLRAFCLRLTVVNSQLEALKKNSSFQIQVETSETAFKVQVMDPHFEEFPWIELDETDQAPATSLSKLIPIRNIKSELFNIQTFYLKLY